MALLFLLGLTAVAQACGRDPCSLNQARGCGGAATVEVQVEPAMIIALCDSVVAAALTDIRRLPDAYLILVEMPGVTSSGVTMEVSSASRFLSIAGVLREQREPFLRRDRGAVTKMFARKFVLPEHVDADRISHRLDSGILRVTLPLVPGSGSSSEEQQQALEERARIPLPEIRAPAMTECTVAHADGLIRPEALVSSKDDASCDDSGAITILPLVDILDRPGSYVVVVEMPGAESAEVEIVPGRGETRPVLSVTGVARDDGDLGQAVRQERGASNKVFARRLEFPVGSLQGCDASYELTDGLLKVTLLKAVPGVWGSVADLWHGVWGHYRIHGL